MCVCVCACVRACVYVCVRDATCKHANCGADVYSVHILHVDCPYRVQEPYRGQHKTYEAHIRCG